MNCPQTTPSSRGHAPVDKPQLIKHKSDARAQKENSDLTTSKAKPEQMT